MEESRSTVDVTAIELLKRLLEILDEENAFDRSGNKPVVRFVQPDQLRERLDIDLSEQPASLAEIETAIRQTIRYSVKTFSPHFHNQLYAGVDEYGLVGSWLTDVFNTSQYTYEVAPVFTLMERQVIERSLELVGYPPMPDGDGMLSPGGSMSNMYGMVIARFKMFPEIKTKGLAGLPPLVCFTSEGGHYSITKGAHWLGLGTDHVYKVKTDELGRMRPDDLRAGIAEARKQGHLPFFVNATCGTTVLGAIDPLPEIAAICREENIWLHVDACLGGTLLLSEKYRTRLTGIELSNSVAWNPHKMLGAPFQCSLFLVNGKNMLHETNCAGARYLFQQDKHYDVSWDTGDKSLQCGRKVDGPKMWLMWKARGTRGLRESVDLAMHAIEYFYERIKGRDGFRLVLPSYECCNVCFWYVPPSMRGQEETPEWWDNLYSIITKIKERMMVEGSLMVGYTPLSYKNVGNFFRMVVTCQPPPTEAAMDYAIEKIEKFAVDL
ncbi:PREDICTED: cysteine sulfinic acid decarboxylase-like [Dufourea novaeangliae]|uniref:Glutamate decarboxylase 1 n=1 Tax=Dufourea novaeangliae TaxID=178035 RepID=A0A154PGW2_DUFNO|nr:PREDICTED: cysteine sulfinic acid decarboxylase-like [Dufourea novaeangliae]KZC11083.1 Glutamate decarboxylase 1 [Dufourea novaeangliae]